MASSDPSQAVGSSSGAATSLEAGQARPPPRYLTSLCSGAFAGLSVDLSLFPLDTLKTRLQSPQGFWAAGGFKGIYQGLSSVAAGSAPGAAIFFVTYEGLKKELLSNASLVGTIGAGGAHMMAASVAEVAACLIRVPTEVLKSRFQAGVYGREVTVVGAIGRILAREGPRGMWKGYATTVAREIPFTCIQFPMYERLKLMLLQRHRERHPEATSLPAYQAALVGSFSGGVAAATTTPLDVVKTRLMLAERGQEELRAGPKGGGTAASAAGHATLPQADGVNQRFLPTLLHIYRTEGAAGLYKGVVPRTIWISIGGAVFLGSFEIGLRTIEG
ncbi:unnamed protein product [Parajaminaea phylloscopi]